MSEFIESIQMWINNLSVNSIIIFIMMIFMLIGAVIRDRLIESRETDGDMGNNSRKDFMQ